MTANEMIPAVGATVSVRFEDCQVLCSVIDVKTSWNKPRLLIRPLAGAGSQWVELGRVRLATTPEGATDGNRNRLPEVSSWRGETMKRYATIHMNPLNAGAGEIWRNFATRREFEQFILHWAPRAVPADSGTGSFGDGIFGFQYWIYPRSYNTREHIESYGRTLESRLLEYKNRLHLQRGEPIQLHAFDSWRSSTSLTSV